VIVVEPYEGVVSADVSAERGVTGGFPGVTGGFPGIAIKLDDACIFEFQ
jgi:hypothetical protein